MPSMSDGSQSRTQWLPTSVPNGIHQANDGVPSAHAAANGGTGAIEKDVNDSAPNTGTNKRRVSLWISNPYRWITRRLNFFRIHLLCFIFIPLVASVIFWASDENDNSYIDCLTMCYSVMTVTGLDPIAMSDLTYWQCAILFFLTTIGSVSFVSLVTIIVRQYYFLKHFEEIIKADRERRRLNRQPILSSLPSFRDFRLRVFSGGKDDEEEDNLTLGNSGNPQAQDLEAAENQPDEELPSNIEICSDGGENPHRDPGSADTSRQSSATAANEPHVRFEKTKQMQTPKTEHNAGNTTLTSNAEGPRKRYAFIPDDTPQGGHWYSVDAQAVPHGPPLVRTYSRNPHNTAMNTGLGGFGNPLRRYFKLYIWHIWHKHLPNARLPRAMTLKTTRPDKKHRRIPRPRASSFSGHHKHPTHQKDVNYISFDAIVGRNSKFINLTSEQREELGGVEYRALKMLKRIVLAYILLFQLIPMAIFCPIFSTNKYARLLENGGVPASAGAWMVAFTVNNAYNNCGLTLFDDSMTPVQDVYGWVLTISFLILAGNVAFPMLLRFVIWSLSKIVPKHGRHHETLTFLLDHPRRCFFYLFPSYQTWSLVLLLLIFNGIDMVSWALFNRDLPVWETLDPGSRLLNGYFQSVATRGAGFTILNLREIGPAQQLLTVLLMYISVYPNAMSIRSTNVYEERSLGIRYTDSHGPENYGDPDKPRKPFKYLVTHLRRQLAFDVYALMSALWVVCICERTRILDTSREDYFNVFSVFFEIISGYGTVGLSLGTPNGPYSLCHEWAVLSKLVLCAVMVRGRHRGLPEAIDRSVLLPADIEAMIPRSQMIPKSSKQSVKIEHQDGTSQSATVRPVGES